MTSPSQDTFDIAIIGAGPGGYVAAIRAAQLGARVAIVEKQYIGGTCLNVGCIPSKALLHVAEEYQKLASLGAVGITVGAATFDMPAAVRHKAAVVKQLTDGTRGLLRANGVTIFNGRGTVDAPGAIAVESADGTRQSIHASKIVLAQGSVPAKPPFPGIDGANVIFSTEALELTKVPESLVCIGGGVIAIEFACLFNALGTRVTIVEMLPSLIAYEEPETVKALMKVFQRRGIEINLDTKVESIGEANGQKVVQATGPNGAVQFSGEYVLVAVGRTANPDGIQGLISNGLAMDRSRVVVDEHMQTNLPGIYAIGDLSGKTQLAHVAMQEGEVAVEHALGHDSHMNYDAVPRPVYTFPEIASVGLTEAQAKERDPGARSGTFPWVANGKALASDATEGFVKVIVGSYGEILGASIIGPDATNLITEYTLAMRGELTMAEIIETIHPHPTFSEAMREAVLSADRHAIHIFQRPR